MEGKELIKRLLMSYPVIYGGAMMATWLCCIIYSPEIRFGLDYFAWMFLVALLGDLPLLWFYSRKELTNKQWRVRLLLHFITLETILLLVGYYMTWYETFTEGLVFTFSILCVYVIVRTISFTGDLLEARKLNEQLKKLKR